MPWVREWAEAVVRGTTLADKLAAPPDEDVRGDELRVASPGRPARLAIVAGRAARVPPIAGMRDPAQRARILHALANHELQAIELFAWALLAYPDAPAQFRRGLAAIVVEEQRHFGLYVDRLNAHGVAFGDHPVTGHFWNKLEQLVSPIEFVCAMGLTFENANLDFAGEYARAARACGDDATAAALDQVHADEIKHVHFGYVWLRRFAPETAPLDAYLAHVQFPLGPRRARGATFDREARERAGFDAAFIDALAASEAVRPNGRDR